LTIVTVDRCVPLAQVAKHRSPSIPERTMWRISRQLGAVARLTLVCGIVVCSAAGVRAESAKVIAIEEHWELQLGQPDADTSAPQTTMVVSPDGDLEGVHFLFTLNHISAPDYQPGGMQVQLWDGEQLVESAAAGSHAFSVDSEVVRWVQRISLEDETIKFQVLNGQSDTWGSFGGDELSLSEHTSLTGLNSYRPGVSLSESQVSYAENRVVSLTLTKLVWVTDDGQVHEMNAPIAVDTSLDP
jgi:hypothetical protein